MIYQVHHKHSGFTLVELMISLMLGTILIAMAMTAFQAGSRSSRFANSVAEIQSNARFALGEVTSSIRAVGYSGCTSPLKRPPFIPQRVGDAAIAEDDWSPLEGFEVRTDGWLPAMPHGYLGSSSGTYNPPTSGKASPIAGTSAIVLERALGRGTALSTANNNPHELKTDDLSSRFIPGSMAMVSTCGRAEAFHIQSTSVNAGGGALINTVEPLNHVYELNDSFLLDARVISYRRALYFIGETGRFSRNNQPIRSLYEHTFPYADNTPVELADGVDAMVIRYRMLDENGNTREVAADNSDFDPDLVVSVRLGLLFSANESKDSGIDNVAFHIAGVDVEPSTGSGSPNTPTYPNDNRIRLVFEQTAKIRNRNVGNRFNDK